jgi:hypothetical protein
MSQPQATHDTLAGHLHTSKYHPQQPVLTNNINSPPNHSHNGVPDLETVVVHHLKGARKEVFGWAVWLCSNV